MQCQWCNSQTEGRYCTAECRESDKIISTLYNRWKRKYPRCFQEGIKNGI